MENNGKANAMETLKAKVSELKENWNGPLWPLVVLAVFLAMPMVGGMLALGTYLVGANAVTVIWVVGSVVYYTYVVYKMIYTHLVVMEKTFVTKPVHNDEDFS